MRVLTYGDIMDGGQSVFTSVARLDGDHLEVAFNGVIRVENPHKELKNYLDELSSILPDCGARKVTLDFTGLSFCNSNGFYVIMDITELIYQSVDGPVVVKRLEEDDWQQETLPILLDIEEEEVGARTRFEDVKEL
ncbi:MAG: hypothetical protein IPO67_23400 [Deltaproteobacteria bacterium]|jgi:hypothetical protein|nr:hypothetical protein [Deltaproteobacteria bacterium]MBK9648061.1 hypothetical protein [Deltaproteobacteria bacterium]MCK6514504.1 hypothetical protein [Myxococcota bacterium]